MNVSSNLILLICVLNCLTQRYHLNWFSYYQQQIDHWLPANYHSQFYAWKKHVVAFNFETIYKQIEWAWWIFQDDCWFDPLHRLLKIKKWGILQKDKMGKWENQRTNCIYCQKKPKVKPPLNRKGNQILSKKKWPMASNFKKLNS
jgi:hypothetical protein